MSSKLVKLIVKTKINIVKSKRNVENQCKQ